MSAVIHSNAPFRPKPINASQPIDGSMHFNIGKQPKEAFEIMNHLRQNSKLCDVVLLAGSERFPVHKLVLSSVSPYFKAMFCTGMKEAQMAEIPLQGIRATILATIIEYAYTSELHVSEMNVCALLPAASMFQMTHIVEACCTFLDHQLDPANCVGIADFAQAFDCPELYQKARQYIYQNFGRMCQHEEFMLLSPSQLMQVIKRDELNVRCESEVYKAVVNWVKYDLKKRHHKMEQLLSAVRCHLLTPAYLQQQLDNCEVLKTVTKCRDYLSRIHRDLIMHKKCPERHRINLNTVVYVAGGYLRHSISNVECYNSLTKDWLKLADLPLPRSGVAACVVQNMLYVIGGRNNSPDGNVDSASVDMYDPSTNCWSKCNDMASARNRVGAGVIDTTIYAVGGSCGGTHHKSVESYNPETNTWTNICEMGTRRIGVGVATVNRLLYAVGGFDGENRLASVECYHPEKDVWQYVAAMNTTRSGAGVSAMGQYVFAVGGYDSTYQLSTVERYDVELDQWHVLSSMNRPRSALSVVVLDDSLLALGGYDGNEFLSSVERYNIEHDEWHEETVLSSGRSGHGVAVGNKPFVKN